MKISENFAREEFDCHSGQQVPDVLMENLIKLVDGVCQPIRDRAGPLTVTSGYRSPEYNARIGGAGKSNHMTARAADLTPTSISVPELHALILEMKTAGQLPRLGGLGLYPGWVHVDTYQTGDGHLRQWTGSGIGSEKTA